MANFIPDDVLQFMQLQHPNQGPRMAHAAPVAPAAGVMGMPAGADPFALNMTAPAPQMPASPAPPPAPASPAAMIPDDVAQGLGLSFGGTKGIASRTNNPGNLKFAGQRGASKGESGFAQFGSMLDGFRALERQVELDAGRGFTIRQWADKYAPAADGNDPDAWARGVAQHAGVDPSTPLTEVDRGALARAVAMVESSTSVDGSGVPSPGAPTTASAPPAPPGLQLAGQTVRPGRDVSAETAMVDAGVERSQQAASQASALRTQGAQDMAQTHVQSLIQQEQANVINRERNADVMRAASEARAKLVSENPKVDPDKFVKDTGVGAIIAGALAAAAVGALNAMGGNPNAPNPVVQAFQNAAQRSMAAQREDVANRREDRARAMSYYERQYERAEMRSLAYEADFFALGAKKAEIMANAQGVAAEEKARLLEASAALAQHGEQLKLGLMQQAADQRTLQYAAPTPQGPMTTADLVKEALAQRDLASLSTTGRTHDENQKATQSKAPNEQEARVSAATASLDRMAQEAGLVKDAEGNYQVESAWKTAAKIAMTNLPGADALGNKLLIDAQNAAQATARAFTGAGMPAAEAEVAARSVGYGQWTPQGLADTLNSMRVRLEGFRQPKPDYSASDQGLSQLGFMPR